MKTMRSMAWLLLVLAAAVLTGCAETDAGITTKVKSQLAADDVVKAHEIDVTTQDKRVTLTGNVDSEDAKQRALTIARDTKGVVDVVDMITVQTETGAGDAPEPIREAGTTVDDAGTTMKVKGRLLADDTVRGLQIDVDTRGGVVYLTGKVGTEQEKERAITLARETEGVADVQANLEIVPR